MIVRVIHAVLGDLEQEEVTFTEDFNSPAQDFVPQGWTVHTDAIYQMDLPVGFPMEVALRAQK